MSEFDNLLKLFLAPTQWYDHSVGRVTNWPPDEIITKEDRAIVRFALAGWTPTDIEIYVDKGKLIVKGEKKLNSKEEGLVHSRISNRSFRWERYIGKNYDDIKPSMENGILEIQIIFKKEDPVRYAIQAG